MHYDLKIRANKNKAVHWQLAQTKPCFHSLAGTFARVKFWGMPPYTTSVTKQVPKSPQDRSLAGRAPAHAWSMLNHPIRQTGER